MTPLVCTLYLSTHALSKLWQQNSREAFFLRRILELIRFLSFVVLVMLRKSTNQKNSPARKLPKRMASREKLRETRNSQPLVFRGILQSCWLDSQASNEGRQGEAIYIAGRLDRTAKIASAIWILCGCHGHSYSCNGHCAHYSVQYSVSRGCGCNLRESHGRSCALSELMRAWKHVSAGSLRRMMRSLLAQKCL